MDLLRTRGDELRSVLPVSAEIALAEIDRLVGIGDLSSLHQRLFARPTVTAGEILWQTDALRRKSYPDLLPEDRDALTSEVGRIISDIRRIAQRESAAGRGLLLSLWPNLIEIPNFDHLHAVDGHPVLTAWGMISQNSKSPTGQLLRFDDGVTWQAPARRPVGLWAAAAGALAVLAVVSWFLLPPILSWAFPSAGACQVEPNQLATLRDLVESEQRQQGLNEELARIRIQIGQRQLACPLPQAQRPPQPERPNDVARAEQRGAQRGRLQVVLAWDGPVDLDLHVVCPSGQTLSWQDRRACGGELDVDSNAESKIVPSPVENASFASPDAGNYRILVNYYKRQNGPAAVPYRITILKEGSPPQVIQGRASESDRAPRQIGSVSIP